MNVTFKARRGKTKLTIYAVVRINGQEKRISTGLSSIGRNFRRGKFTGEQAGRLNNQLQIIATELYQIFDTLRAQYTEVSPQLIYDTWTGKKQLSYTFLEVFQLFINNEKKRYESGIISRGVYEKNGICYRMWEGFLKANRLTHIKCEQIKSGVVENWELYAKQQRNYSQNYLNKILAHVRQCLGWAVKQDYADKNPLQSHRYTPAKKKPIIYLSPEELGRLEQRSFSIERLQKCLDAFLLQCYTSLSFAEMKRLNTDGAEKYIYTDAHGAHWLRIYRKKVANALQPIPISQKAMNLLQKYNYRLPVLTNQKYNAYLKEIGDLTQIEEYKMKTHTGRRTCGMYLLNELKLSIETVSKILGHSNIQTTQRHYAEVIDSRIAQELRQSAFEFAK